MTTTDISLSFGTACICSGRLGDDISLLFWGGDRPHIGCTVMAVPRPSLTEDGSISVTSSVLNLTGHKDEHVCRLLAEEVCRQTGKTVVCTGGFHVDNITKTQIDELLLRVREKAAGGFE